MKTWIVDRIEGDLAIIEFEGEFFEINLQLLPEINEGDQLQLQNITNEKNNVEESSEAMEEAKARLERLKQRSEPPPDVFDL